MVEIAEPIARPLPAEPTSAAVDERGAERVRIYIWQVPVRFSHWLTAACIVVLSLTGGYIADPFLIPPGGSVMGTVRTIHIVTAFAFLVSGIIRTVWLLTGNRFARWTAFIPTNRRQATELFRQAGFYSFVRSEIPKVLGHNQLAAAAYVVLFVLLLIETVTGFALDGVLGSAPAATLFGWLWELVGTQTLRLIHHLSMWAILVIALFHIYSCILVDGIEKNGLLSSIFSGYKFPTRAEVIEARDGGPDLLEAAVSADAEAPVAEVADTAETSESPVAEAVDTADTAEVTGVEGREDVIGAQERVAREPGSPQPSIADGMEGPR